MYRPKCSRIKFKFKIQIYARDMECRYMDHVMQVTYLSSSIRGSLRTRAAAIKYAHPATGFAKLRRLCGQLGKLTIEDHRRAGATCCVIQSTGAPGLDCAMIMSLFVSIAFCLQQSRGVNEAIRARLSRGDPHCDEGVQTCRHDRLSHACIN
jgi:hypothetical protein